MKSLRWEKTHTTQAALAEPIGQLPAASHCRVQCEAQATIF